MRAYCSVLVMKLRKNDCISRKKWIREVQIASSRTLFARFSSLGLYSSFKLEKMARWPEICQQWRGGYCQELKIYIVVMIPVRINVWCKQKFINVVLSSCWEKFKITVWHFWSAISTSTCRCSHTSKNGRSKVVHPIINLLFSYIFNYMNGQLLLCFSPKSLPSKNGKMQERRFSQAHAQKRTEISQVFAELWIFNRKFQYWIYLPFLLGIPVKTKKTPLSNQHSARGTAFRLWTSRAVGSSLKSRTTLPSSGRPGLPSVGTQKLSPLNFLTKPRS